MKISKTEMRLRRLLAAAPQQTNKRKLVHHVATLKKLLHTLKFETAESSSSHFTDAKTKLYSRCVEELASKLDAIKEDVWESLRLSLSDSVSDGAQELSHGPSTSELPLFPSCLKRKHSPDAGFLSALEFEESGAEDLNIQDDTLGKRKCLDLKDYEAKTLEDLMHVEHEVERVGTVKQEHSREDVDTTGESKHVKHELENIGKLRDGDGIDVAENSCGAEHLEHRVEKVGNVKFEDNREDKGEHVDNDSRLYIREHQNDQENLVSEMLLLSKQIKESSLLLGHSLHDTKEFLRSSELTIRQCLLATTSAHLRTGELLSRTQERECGCATWLSLLLMYFTFVSMVIFIRVT